MQKIRGFIYFIQRCVKIGIYVLGWIFAGIILLSFTDYPYLAYHWLGTQQIDKDISPDYIVVLGAGGMPGPQGLLRCHYAALAAITYPNCKLIIALPADTSGFLNSDHHLMRVELMTRGIDSTCILSETKGINTRTQALEISKLINNPRAGILIVTSPEHMYRSILTFKKVGFEQVSGIATIENSFDEELLLGSKDGLKSDKNSEKNLDLRYNMWSYMQYEIIVLREWTALSYYKLKGYI